MALGVVAMAAAGTAVTYACCRLFGFDAGTGAGLLSGAMTSTPSLAAAVETVGHARAPAAYGVTYGFGVIGVALAVHWLPRLLRIDIRDEEGRLGAELSEIHPPITFHHIEVSNPNLFGKRVADIFLKSIAPVTITRLLRQGATEPELVGADTELREGDRLRVVGRPADLEKVELFIGRPVAAEIAFDRLLTKKSIVVSKRQFAGTTLGYFNFREAFNVQVARITRNGIDLPADAHTRLHLGDVAACRGRRTIAAQHLPPARQRSQGDLRNQSAADPRRVCCSGFFSARCGCRLPIIGPLTLGTTGGTLLVGLLLGARYQTGPLIWDLPAAGNRLIRDLGLALFMAAVGTSAGVDFVATLRAQGLPLLFSGVLVTLIPVAVGAFIGLRFLRIRFLRLLGVLVGGMTSASGLGRRRRPHLHSLCSGRLCDRLSGGPDRQNRRR